MAKQLEYPTASPYTDHGRVPSMIPQLIRRPLLVKDEELDLMVRARNGDDAARRKVVEANMRLVCNIARQFHSQLVPFEDLVQEGAIGLMHAVDRFDASKGCRFTTYAVFWVKQAVSKATLYRSRVIRLPAHVVEEKKRLARFRREFEEAHGRAPTGDEIARGCGYSNEKLSTLAGAEHECLSLDGQGGASDYAALLPDHSCDDPEDAALRNVDRETIRLLLSRLSERERSVIVRRLGLEGNSVPEEVRVIARDLGVSRNAVQTMEACAIRSLRRMIEDAESKPERVN